jgi:hypothetical protein
VSGTCTYRDVIYTRKYYSENWNGLLGNIVANGRIILKRNSISLIWCLYFEWIQGRAQWPAVVNTVMNPRILCKVGNLTNGATVSFSRRIVSMELVRPCTDPFTKYIAQTACSGSALVLLTVEICY